MTSRRTFQFTANVLQATSIFTCLLVICSARVLDRRKIHPDYQFIVTFNATIDLMFACFLCAFSFTPILVDHVLIITVEQPLFQNMSGRSTAIVVQAMVSLVEATILCVAVHFYYRYKVVCKSQSWTHRRYLTTYFGWFSLVVLYFILSLSAVEKMEDYVEVLKGLENYRNNTPVFCVYDVDHTPSVLMLSFYQLILTVFYAFTGYCGFKVVRKVKKYDPTVKSTLRAQRYMVGVLALQAIYPLFLLTLPATLMVILAYLRVTVIPYYFLSIMLQSLPLLNSISILTLVPSYRRLITGQKQKHARPFMQSDATLFSRRIDWSKYDTSRA
ncbi:unnamed protein product [Bursaphelenchus xylophilus]|uniref:(pine wood nematode) hypothetical protein n=1 Tax=Bursaphelenchus xylophilus TaxID=6326 RepID=A0A1I7RVX2_BURXY|nr:unnamed protein product [Bursaphelenchus xylophilus]CAG9094819.1 unnamed protein product [Bursaphelenchus xylophilus]